MKNKIFFIFLGFILTAALLTNAVLAQGGFDDSNIQYPITELGNCKNKEDCWVYCEKSEHLSVCIAFAEEHNLMDSAEIEKAKKFIAAGGKGPGDCTTKNSCEKYCDNINHIDECITFAEKTGIISPEELAEAKKVQAAIKKGIKPPSCGSKKACDIYCEDPAHMEECIIFAEAAGFISGQELENAKKMLQAIKKGAKPLPCRGKEECDIYCANEAHFEECITFAEAAGFISSEDAIMARKTGGKGPGDCQSKEECDVFCDKIENQEICFNFAKKHGLIPEGDIKQIEEGRQKMFESLINAPPEVIECLNSTIGSEMIEKLKSGAVMPTQEMGEKMRQCFETMMKQMPIGPEGQIPEDPGMMPVQGMPQDFTGPGGCKTPEECMEYCKSNPQECMTFQPPTGQIQPPSGQMPPIPPENGQMPSGQMPPMPPEGGQMPPKGPPPAKTPPPTGIQSPPPKIQ